MRKINLTNSTELPTVTAATGKPMSPASAGGPNADRKSSDPSSASPRGERYAIPAFFEHRIKAREYDPL